MKKKIIVITCLLIIAVVTIHTGIAVASSNNTFFENQKPISGEVEGDLLAKVESYGLSSGDVEFLYEDKDAFGRDQMACGDDLYIYTFDADNHLVSIMLKDELRENYMNQEMHNSDFYVDIIKDYVGTCLPYFNLESTKYEVSLNDDYAYIKIYDRENGCLVNSGNAMLSGDGTLTLISGTSNSFEEFEGKDNYSEEDIKEIIFNSLMEYKEYIDANGLPVADEEEKPFYDVPEADFNEDEGKEITETPAFEIYLNDISDIQFSDIEKQKFGDQVVWFAKAQVSTSWGSFDSALNFKYVYTINADTGEIIEVETLSGD